jgi:hypothetical protein
MPLKIFTAESPTSFELAAFEAQESLNAWAKGKQVGPVVLTPYYYVKNGIGISYVVFLSINEAERFPEAAAEGSDKPEGPTRKRFIGEGEG